MTTTIYILFSFATFVRSFDSTFIHYANIFLNLKSTAPDVNSVHGRVPGIVNLVSIRLHLELSFQQEKPIIRTSRKIQYNTIIEYLHRPTRGLET